MTFRLLCTDVHSESAERLAKKLGEAVGYKVFRSDKVIPNRIHIRYGDARDKLFQYKWFDKNELNFPNFTESKEEAQHWARFFPVVCRTLLRGQEGHGIVIADNPEEVVDAPVYVKYEEKTIEYRVNLFKGEIVNIREKRKKIGAEQEEPRIRNVANGYVFCIPKNKIPEEIQFTALVACQLTDSDIVGVDIAYNEKTGHHFLLEVNSAPALEGITVDEFVKRIVAYYE